MRIKEGSSTSVISLRPSIKSQASPRLFLTDLHTDHYQINCAISPSVHIIMSFSVEIESPVSAARLYKAAAVDWHALGPKLLPEVVVSGTVEGEGEIGSVRQLNFTSALPFSYLKERLDFVDNDKFEYKSTIIDGFNLGKTLKSATIHFKFEPTSSGGSVAKVAANYEALPGVDAAGEIAKGEESIKGQLKAVEAYLLANPTAYA